MSKNKILTLYAAIFAAALGVVSSVHINPAVSSVGKTDSIPVLVETPELDADVQTASREPVAGLTDRAVPKSVQTIPALDEPVRLDIPGIKENISVIRVGLTETGIMDTPNNLTQAGWYEYGTVPGNVGSAVIGAHVDNGYSKPGVFKNLKNLNTGDKIIITMASGKIDEYEVISSESQPYAQVDANKLFNQNDGAYLKLVTCNGTFMPDKGTYDERLVVTAIKSDF